MLSRRGFFAGLAASAVAAPAVVRAASLMPVRATIIRPDELIIVGPHEFVFRTSIPAGSWRSYNQGIPYSKSMIVRSLTVARTRWVDVGLVDAPDE